MAAWLAYLKSACCCPGQQEDPSPEELALRLQLRLQRLGAMREARRLMARDRLRRDVFLGRARRLRWTGETRQCDCSV
jgi:segregation and condensation protein A